LLNELFLDGVPQAAG